MNKIEVTVKEGVTVLHPESGNPIRDGQTVPRSPQIIRFLRDGDLIEITKPKTKKQQSKTQEAK